MLGNWRGPGVSTLTDWPTQRAAFQNSPVPRWCAPRGQDGFWDVHDAGSVGGACRRLERMAMLKGGGYRRRRRTFLVRYTGVHYPLTAITPSGSVVGEQTTRGE